MSFLQLKDIGKIYVSENNVSVGIRNVNLSFDKGEFVAITGASGSGKSTLLNVISGMDTYEEGELYIEGNPTSHFVQSDWEQYRENYISFIFQDYNIIESFTVLQNVELALMSITNPVERRQRAMELLERVGLTKFLRQKGSKLSGGQKQRCVIARALAKDSPIILADEPTGNLDAQSSREIIALLREVSADKLLIMVTHNFDEVEEYATRQIRVFDGAVEADHVLRDNSVDVIMTPETETKKTNVSQRRIDFSNGYILGKSTFFSKPKLTIFVCLILLIGTLGATIASGLLGNVLDLFKPFYMFTHVEGRVVVCHREAQVFDQEEINSLVEKYDAEYAMQYDAILDAEVINKYDFDYYFERFGKEKFEYATLDFHVTKDKLGSPSIGDYPKDDDEVLLYIPIKYMEHFGKNSIEKKNIKVGTQLFDVVGIKYYYDNTKQPLLVVSEDCYDDFCKLVARNWKDYRNKRRQSAANSIFTTVYMITDYMNADDKIYNQTSLFFKNDRQAQKAAKKLLEDGYLACTSKEKYSPNIEDMIERLLEYGLRFIFWVLIIVFLSFFVNMCTHRSLDVMKNDLAILRSMGISVRVIKISMYMRMYLSMIPGLLLTGIGCAVIFLTPSLNGMLKFIHFGQYLLIFIGVFIITTLVTRKQVRRLFEGSVKKTLKGGSEA